MREFERNPEQGFDDAFVLPEPDAFVEDKPIVVPLVGPKGNLQSAMRVPRCVLRR